MRAFPLEVHYEHLAGGTDFARPGYWTLTTTASDETLPGTTTKLGSYRWFPRKLRQFGRSENEARTIPLIKALFRVAQHGLHAPTLLPIPMNCWYLNSKYFRFCKTKLQWLKEVVPHNFLQATHQDSWDDWCSVWNTVSGWIWSHKLVKIRMRDHPAYRTQWFWAQFIRKPVKHRGTQSNFNS